MSFDERKAMTISSEPNARSGGILSRDCDQMRLHRRLSLNRLNAAPLAACVDVRTCGRSWCALGATPMCLCRRSPLLINFFTSSYSNPHEKQLGVPMEHLVGGSC